MTNLGEKIEYISCIHILNIIDFIKEIGLKNIYYRFHVAAFVLVNKYHKLHYEISI